MPRRLFLITGPAVVAAALLVGTLVDPASAGARALPGHGTPVLGKRVIGHSVQGRKIVAYHLGDPRAKTTALIIGQMHGDEPAGIKVANSIIHGSHSIEGINLWVIPTMNPDGSHRDTRQNAHGVDLNRNWPHNWKRLSGQYYSGPRPLSEPETRAVWKFLKRMRPRYVVSLHQPLDGVDKTAGHGKAYRKFRNALARNLHLQVKNFNCWSVCHGSMSGWYEQHHIGVAVETVEFGWHPKRSYLVGTARRGIVSALHGSFGSLRRHDPHVQLHYTPSSGAVTVRGWAYDVDAPNTRLLVHLDEGTQTLARHRTHQPSPTLDRRRRIRGAHAFGFTLPAKPGTHRYCFSARNLRAGANNRTCETVRVPS
ncbi:MAG TPA: M14 family zinc carboxypeptidase [Jatrophihabitantaceae bacterium]